MVNNNQNYSDAEHYRKARIPPRLDGESCGHFFDAVLPQTQLARLVAASLIQIKRSVAELKTAGILVTEDGLVRVRSASLDGVWQWLCSCEEPVSDFARSKDWRPYVTDH